MFEAAELGSALGKKQYARELPQVRAALIKAQHELAGSKHSCLVIVAGEAAAGKGELIDTLLAWMDARGVHVHTFLSGARSRDEKAHPASWRFWRALPSRGRSAIFFGSWYTRPLAARALGRLGEGELDAELRRIVELERMLASEGVIVVKVWLHLGHKAQRRRIEELRRDPIGRTRLTHRELRDARHHREFRESAEHILRLTSTAEAPWLVINSTHARHRNLAVARALTDALERGTAALEKAL